MPEPMPENVPPLIYRPFLNRNRVVYPLHPAGADGDAIAAAFAEQGFITATSQTPDGLRRLVDLHRPDVVLIDAGFLLEETQLITTLRDLAFGVRVFMLADTNPPAEQVVRAVRAGVIWVFVKPHRLTDMVQLVTDELREDLRQGEGASPDVLGSGSLTPRELEVLRRVVIGETNKEIAASLGISPRTVEVHRAAAMRKLGARNTADMIRLALKP
ncbi:MAG: response regulator transcription factor [Devosia sp.]